MSSAKVSFFLGNNFKTGVVLVYFTSHCPNNASQHTTVNSISVSFAILPVTQLAGVDKEGHIFGVLPRAVDRIFLHKGLVITIHPLLVSAGNVHFSPTQKLVCLVDC